jgi:hypothetical protein
VKKFQRKEAIKKTKCTYTTRKETSGANRTRCRDENFPVCARGPWRIGSAASCHLRRTRSPSTTGLYLGMDSDVWKSELSYLLKMLIWIYVFVFIFNMDVRWMYSNPIFNIIRIRHYPKYPTLFVSAKVKYP